MNPTQAAGVADPDSLFGAHLETLSARYAGLLERHPFDSVAVYSGTPRYRFRDDQAYPFRSGPFYRQWVPADDHAASLVLVRPGQRPVLVLHLPDDYWHSVPEAPDGGWTGHFDVRVVSSAAAARTELPADLARCALVGDPDDEVSGWGFGALNPAGLVSAIEFDRRCKTPYEAACIAEANTWAARGHLAAAQAFLAGESEFGIHLAYLRATAHGEAGLPYDNIVALNEHGATLHYGRLERQRPAEARSFLIDAGATFRGYASDITRTWAGEGHGAFAELVAAVDEAQQALADRLRPGLSYVALHEEAQLAVARILARFGIVDMEPADMVSEGVSRVFLPHGLGHHLGLQVHDTGGKMAGPDGTPIPQPPAWPYLRNLREVEEGNVLTIEPGLYFIDSLLAELSATPHGRRVDWEAIERFRPYGGVRVEDDVWISADGPRNLSREAFARVEAG